MSSNSIHLVAQNEYDIALGRALRSRVQVVFPLRVDIGRVELVTGMGTGYEWVHIPDEQLENWLNELLPAVKEPVAIDHSRVMLGILRDQSIAATHSTALVPSYIDNVTESISARDSSGGAFESTVLHPHDLTALTTRFDELYRELSASRQTVLHLPFPD